MTKNEAKTVLMEHERFLRGEGEYYFTLVPPYSIETVEEAEKLIIEN